MTESPTTQNPTPGPQPVITAETRVKTNLQTIIGAGGVVIAAAVWCTIVYLDVQQLKTAAKDKEIQLDAIAKDMVAIRSQVEKLTWKIDLATASHGSITHGATAP